MEASEKTLRTVEAADARFESLKGSDSVIPKGPYCYRRAGEGYTSEGGRYVMPVELCPYWAIDPEKERQENGYCAMLKSGDWFEGGTFLLWDQVKECGIKDGPEFDDCDDEAGDI